MFQLKNFFFVKQTLIFSANKRCLETKKRCTKTLVKLTQARNCWSLSLRLTASFSSTNVRLLQLRQHHLIYNWIDPAKHTAWRSLFICSILIIEKIYTLKSERYFRMPMIQIYKTKCNMFYDWFTNKIYLELGWKKLMVKSVWLSKM